MPKIYALLITLCLVSLVFSCQQNSEKPLPELSPEFEAVLDAHGEWEKWYRAKAESYAMIHEGVMTEEDAFINLDSRKIRLSNTEFEMGFDGEQTWISPNREAYKGRSLRFYHNLYFYFFNIPYIFTDPGVTVSKSDPKTINGKEYPTFSVSFDKEKGASPDDQYFLLINPETNRLEYLLYTVTFFGAENPPFSALKYEDYRNADGVYFPRILTGYAYENDSLKNIKYQVTFADALLLEEEFDEEIFEKPETGVYGD
ncbi:hypothetical protein PBT90_12520 [Algoriphagus halophytocola]|uniref:Lipoprotein n=1 Tax=Algoriphagus halophytocola TaxID=2991499 RepID=A0ABY6MMJ0_9BACT|nr:MULTISPECIES: DUF6503 family protein [unclassified Algoriphagus]UZD24209.1 hypothetical protein OM944_06845 [Algoriphagus sp. TR-M5]WBL41578.1 hypothetical protein PBT90_12520 [Algoriphagus sp. TR-M9]